MFMGGGGGGGGGGGENDREEKRRQYSACKFKENVYIYTICYNSSFQTINNHELQNILINIIFPECVYTCTNLAVLNCFHINS